MGMTAWIKVKRGFQSTRVNNSFLLRILVWMGKLNLLIRFVLYEIAHLKYRESKKQSQPWMNDENVHLCI